MAPSATPDPKSRLRGSQVPTARPVRYDPHRIYTLGELERLSQAHRPDEGEPTGGAVAWVLIVFAFLAILFGPGLIALACGQVTP